MASSGVLSQTLHSITTTKLAQLSEQRTAFETGKAKLLHALASTTDPIQKTRLLLDGYKALPSMKNVIVDSQQFHLHAREFLEQSQRDPSISIEFQKRWQAQIQRELHTQSLRYEYASLYGRMVMEWLSNPNDAAETSEDGSVFEKLGRKEMHEQRAQWEAYVFTAGTIENIAMEGYLDGLFCSTKQSRAAVETLRKDTSEFEKAMDVPGQFNETVLKHAINGLLQNDSVTAQKRDVLLDIQSNKDVLYEVIDVLNMRLSSLDAWQWDPAGHPAEQRRQLNGKYRVYYDEDLLQALFLRFIGVQWSVRFREILTAFCRARGTWKQLAKPIPKERKMRREYYLGEETEFNFYHERQETFKEDYFLSQMLQTEDEVDRGYNAESAFQESFETRGPKRKSPVEIKEALLHMLATDIVFGTRLHDNLTVVQSDFKWFGPSLSHSAIFAVLTFFGVSARWIRFFTKALQAPLKLINDGFDAPVQIRKCGVPLSNPLSDFFAETVLFCLDYAVNQRTEGALLYRLHDDFWFWGGDEECVKAWDAINEFTKVTGLELNKEKTGSARINRKNVASVSKSPSLPEGNIHWGFLILDPKAGRFVIDQVQVDTHIDELQRQLDACKSVFAWIQAWNTYAVRFFLTNFGKPANCLGRQHIDMMLNTFEHIQLKIFSPEKLGAGNVTLYVKKMIEDRFDISAIADGFLYFPTNLGGLELKSPFVPLYQIRDHISEDPNHIVDRFFEREEEAYQKAKQTFEDGGLVKDTPRLRYIPEDSDIFMSFEEYTRYREQTSPELLDAYRELHRRPAESFMAQASEVSSVMSWGVWKDLSPYDKWIVSLYAASMIEKFDGLSVVEKGLLPIGLVSMFRKTRVRWQG